MIRVVLDTNIVVSAALIRGEDLGFPLETSHALGIAGEALREDLQRHVGERYWAARGGVDGCVALRQRVDGVDQSVANAVVTVTSL